MNLVKVAVDAPLLDALTYVQNPEFTVSRGDIVNVSLGKRNVKGFVLSCYEKSQDELDVEFGKKISLKAIISVDEEWPKLTDPFLTWLEWMAEYYIHPLGQIIQAAFPPLRKQTKTRASKRPPVIPQLDAKAKPELTVEQKKCIDGINLNTGFSTHLIHGVTGSGKTEIYLRLFEQCLAKNQKGLFLLPEISLTPQLVNRFVERFGNQVAVLHSQLTDRERTNQWWEITQGEKNILIGARSALFCPVNNIGLIVVDEEHESSFKQDEKLKYNGRDCAIMLAKYNKCAVILGSATPSLETWKNAIEKKYQLHSLVSRVADRPLPEISIVDMRLEKENPDRPATLPFWLSNELFKKMTASLSNGEQIALLLNRRGMAQVVFCQKCGYTADCPNCDISLTLHAKHHLVCHYCDYHQNYEVKCPDCSEGELTPLGLGTERVEEDLRTLFPEKKIARADRDEITNRLEMENLIGDMETGAIDILIGTQMIAKGLDFPKLKLVGLLLADVGFNLPDFRSGEKSFQLITQMSGRSGRHVAPGESAGTVIIQAYNTEHESLVYAQKHDFIGFATNELQNRAPLHYPPFQKMLSFRIQSLSLDSSQAAAKAILARAQALKDKFPQYYSQIEVLGPAASPLSRLKNQYRFHLILKGPKAIELNQLARQVLGDEKWIPSQVKVVVDVDPISLL
jgi:primosomal protein N' (replication factor Y) (superfamily II helicase)